MATYKSNLTALHKLRTFARDAQRARVADALRAEAAVDEQEAAVRAELEEMRISQRNLRASTTNVSILLDFERYEVLLKAQAASLAGQRQAVAEELDRRRADLASAEQQVRVVEKIDERREREFNLDQRRQEQKATDEIATNQYLRRRTHDQLHY